MALAIDTTSAVPGVYRHAAEAAAGFPRVRTDVVGFVGVAGPSRLGEAVRLDDYRSFELIYGRGAQGELLAPPLGAQLWGAVRAFFANGGARCWVVNVAASIEESQKLALLDAMLGFSGRTGLELLLVEHREVAIVVLPELEAWIASKSESSLDAPIADHGQFQRCERLRSLAPITSVASEAQGPLFTPAEVLEAQRALLERVGREKWRVFALVTTPAGLSPKQAQGWRAALVEHLADPDAGALYWPWLHTVERPSEAPRLSPPLGFVAGVYARRDLARGPHVAPANESLHGVVAVERDVSEEEHGALNAVAVNVLRPFVQRGVQIWGARTLAFGRGDFGALGYVNVRRCLTAIERTADFFGQRAVFEPNQPLTRFVLSQAITRYLLEVHRKGGLAGASEQDSFFVRCDASNNPPALVDRGQLICEVGVAIAVSAEFIVFRLGQREGALDIQELR